MIACSLYSPSTPHRAGSVRHGRARRLPRRRAAGAAGSRRQDRRDRGARRWRRQRGAGGDRRRGAALGAEGIWRGARARQLYTLAAAAASGRLARSAFSRPSFSHRWSSCSPACSSISSGSSSRCCGSRPAARWCRGYSAWLQTAFAGENLPTSVPRLAVVAFTVILLVLAIGGVAGWPGDRVATRRAWLVVANRSRAVRCARGVRSIRRSHLGVDSWRRSGRTTVDAAALGRRYAEVLSENLGQPGFRELVVVTTDLDARRDVVASLLAEPYRQSFLAPRPGRDRRSEVLDLAGVSRDHVIDVMCAGLTPSQLCDPHLMTFAPDSFWRGETHRLCDRPGSLERLLEEVAEAGATQVIIVTAIAPRRRLRID